MTRERIVGHLHVVRTRKRYDGLITDYIARLLEEDGKVERREWPPIYFVHTDRLNGKLAGTNRYFMFRFKGRPKKLDRSMENWRIQVITDLENWSNGLGAYLIRPNVVWVEAPAEDETCHCEQPENILL